MQASQAFGTEVQIRAEFDLPSEINWARVSGWIDHLRPYPDAVHNPSVGLGIEQETATRYLQLCFEFMGALLEVLRVPVLDPPRTITLQKPVGQDRRHRSNFALTAVRLTPDQLYVRVCKKAFECLTWANDHDMSLPNRALFYANLEANLIEPLKSISPGGKSTVPVLKAANNLGIPFVHLGLGVYQLGWGSKARLLDRSCTSSDSAIGSKLSHHKVATANLLRLAGMPTPSQRVFCNLKEVKPVIDQLPYPVVVKPTDCERGEGVTIEVMSPEEVGQAFEVALSASKRKEVLIENQVPGVCHRFFIACGKLLYAVRRNPMSVFGDGSRTVDQLVSDECAAQSEMAPWNRSEIQPIDAEALLAMDRAGYSRDSIPLPGMRVPLRRIESTQMGGIDDDVTALAHPDNIAMAIGAAKMLRLEVAGIDIISVDISRPWHENDAVINEVNFAPLLGGAPISRSYLPKFFSLLIDGDGRIPVEVYDNQANALNAFNLHRQNGLRCFFTSEQQTVSDRLEDIHLYCSSLKDRVIALLCRIDVDAIVVWRTKTDGTYTLG